MRHHSPPPKNIPNNLLHASFFSVLGKHSADKLRNSLLTCLFSLCLGLFLSIIDSSIVATALYTIGIDLGNLRAVNWIALAYTLAYLGCAVAFAHVSDVIGRRNAFILAYVLFLAFSMASGFAQNIRQLITFRTIQGVGGSGP